MNYARKNSLSIAFLLYHCKGEFGGVVAK